MRDPVQVSVRLPGTESGGPVVPARIEDGHLDGRGDFLILVHGYNNSRSFARERYRLFLDNLKKKFNTQTAQIVEFHWPGDDPDKIISALSYPNQIQPAIDSAKQLALFLEGLPRAGPIVLHMVGHSLGCRLILELLARWTRGLPQSIAIGAIVLMAAAVKVRSADVGGPLRSAIALSFRNPVLYSKGDEVLHWAFPLGETAAGEGFFPTAVGRTGGPLNTWHVPSAMSHNGEAYSHGSYWPGEESATVAAFALGGAPPTATPENVIAGTPAPIENTIASRTIPSRSLLARPAFA
jgi:pimeloyl-ACP methyl ester carboxylesterase